MFRNLIVYGAGEQALNALKDAEFKKKVSAVVVGTDYLNGEWFCGIPLKSEVYLNEIEEDFDLVFATQYFDKIYPKLLQNGMLSNTHLGKVYVQNTMALKRPYDNEITPRITSEEWRWLERQIEDERSLLLLSQIKKERQSSTYPSPRAFVPIELGLHHAGSGDYWDTIPGKRTHENAVVIDAGAFVGDSVERIVKNVGGRVKAYYALEPASQNFELLKTKVFDRVDSFVPLKVALGKENTTISFYYNEDQPETFSRSRRNGEYEETVEIITIDSLPLYEDADYFVKMDIEGGELEALMGAKEFLESKRPNLAICVYHKNRDIIEIPRFLKSCIPDYCFYLVGGSHTILIAR